MSIEYEFPSRHTIRIKCGDEVMEIVLPMGSSPAAFAPAPAVPAPDSSSDRGRVYLAVPTPTATKD